VLFVGDAQVGNWLSWPAVTCGDEKGKEILNRTVFYKVGHHGSRNATLNTKGLELMDPDNLVAMIPVDQVWANFSRTLGTPRLKTPWCAGTKDQNRLLRADQIGTIAEALQSRIPSLMINGSNL